MFFKYFKFLLVILVTFCLSISLTFSQQNTGIISGKAIAPADEKSSKLNPVENATISIEGTPYKTSTSPDGSFSFSSVPFGTYKIKASKTGYRPDEKTITLNTEIADISLTLTPENKVTATPPGKGKSTPKGKSLVFVAFAAPPSAETHGVAPQVGSIQDFSILDPAQIEAAIAAGADPLSLGIGTRPRVPSPYDPVTPMSTNQNTVMLFDPNSPQQTTYITLSSQPYWVCYSPATQLLYVSNHAKQVLVIDTTKNGSILGAFNIGGYAADMVSSPDGKYIYIAVMSVHPKVLIVDSFKNKFIKKISTPKKPLAIAVSPNGNKLYVACGTNTSGEILIYNAKTGSQTGTVKVGHNPNGMVISPDGKTLYVANLSSGTVSVVDTATLSVKDTLAVGVEPVRLAITPKGDKVYVTCRKTNWVAVIDTAHNQVIKQIPVKKEPVGVSVNSTGTRVYVTSNLEATISIIDTKSDVVVQTTASQFRSQGWGIAAK